ncbi:very short patch repair endonuclease [Mesorhizobium sp. ISC15]|uniref:very short patch repair endonuclease n=1 Tax=Mesorhizobium sp. ISC15 TaxID=3076429 RepID=UPI00301B9C31
MDTVDRQTRAKIMASVGQKNTGAELLLRRALHKIGLRYRLHDRALPGSPDLVFRRFGAVAFIHGCYWHSHDCYRATVPKERHEFWVDKFQTNRARDQRNVDLLLGKSWRVLTVWECALLGKHAKGGEAVALEVRNWLNGGAREGLIEGEKAREMLPPK